MKPTRIASLALLAMITLTLIVPNIAASAHVTPPPPITKMHVYEENTSATDYEPVYPTCQFGPLNPVGPAPLTVHFDASSSKDAVGYSWYTADGTSTGGQITWDHTFLNEGTYKVRLTTYSAEGSFNYCTTWVTVQAAVPTLTPPAPTLTATQTPPPAPDLNLDASSQEGCNETTIEQSDNGITVFVCGDLSGEINIYPSVTQTPPTEPEAPASTSLWQKLGIALMKLVRAVFGIK